MARWPRTMGSDNNVGSVVITVASDQLVVFGDGMEDDHLTASWGQEITVQLGEKPLRLVM